MKVPPNSTLYSGHCGVAVGVASALLVGLSSQAQTSINSLPASLVQNFEDVMGARVEALNVLGGDYGLSGGSYKTTDNRDRTLKIDVSKFGGYGDIGDPRPFGSSAFSWQPRVQGNMGYLTAKNHLHSGIQDGDVSEYDTFAIQFGGGARLWWGDHLSLTPTIMGMYGHSYNFYTANNPATQSFIPEARSLGLVDWDVDTWTLRPAAQLAYNYTWHRTIFTLASEFTYYHTESFHESTTLLNINGDSESLRNLIDVDIPLGRQLFGHELRTGGYFARTEFFDGLKRGLNTDHMYDAHGRIVLDFLGQLWKVQWLGLGASYLWGSNFDGYTFGADVNFRF